MSSSITVQTRGRSRSRAPRSRSMTRSRSSSRHGTRSIGTQFRRRIPLALKKQHFVERANQDILNVRPEATATGLFKSFSLDQIPQAANYAALFDDYKIDKVVVTFRYKGTGQNARVIQLNSPEVIVPVNEVNPVLYYKIDHNDEDQNTLAQLKESAKTREHQFTNNNPNFSIVIKPANLISTDNMVGASAPIGTHRPKWGQWLHSADQGIKYFGLKAYAVADTGAGTSYAGALEVTYKYYFSMKNNE